MGLKRFPQIRIFLALSTSLALLAPGYAANDDSSVTPTGTGAAGSAAPTNPGAGTADGTGAAAAGSASASTGSASTPVRTEKTAIQQPERRKEEERRTTSVPVHAAAQQPVRLYGRIEELTAGAGAKFPLKMQAMVPIRDVSLDAKVSKLAGNANLQKAYPMDFRGQWTGELTVWDSRFDPTYFQFDHDQAEKESQLLKRNTKGMLTANFYQSAKGIELQPCECIFQGTDSMADQLKNMGGNNAMSAMMGGANGAAFANMRMPITYALHFGTPIEAGSLGVSGNAIRSSLMKNTLRQLAKGVLEQQVVTRDNDTNRNTGKSQSGYSESVLRFTYMSSSQIYLQAAYVYYRNDGKFQAKYILYGTLNKSYGAQPGTQMTPYASGGQANPFGGLLPQGGGQNPFGGGAGGAGGLQQEMQQVQKMLQQMNGR